MFATFPGPQVVPLVNFLNVQGSGANSTTYNFSNVPIGDPHQTREIFLAVGWRSASSAGRFVSSGTIGGISLTANHVSAETSGQTNEEGIDLVSASVPTGTTANISITMSGSCLDLDFGVFRVIGLKSTTAVDTASTYAGSGASNLQVNVNQGGIVIAAALLSGVTTATWTGVTEAYDQAGSDSEYAITGAFAHRLATEINRTISINAGTDKPWVVASFR